LSLVTLSIILGTIFYALEIIHGKAKTLQIVLLISFLVLGIGWVGIRNPFILWPARFGTILYLIITFYKFRPKKKLLFTFPKSWCLVVLGIISAIIPKQIIFYLFAAGYDNSSHIGFLYRTWKIGSYEYGLQGNGKFIPAYINLANGYPSLQMESWASILRVLNLSIANSEALLRFFLFFSLLTVILLLYVLFSYLDRNSYQNLLMKVGITGFVLFSSISSIFWSGFPPTIWGITFSLLALRTIMFERAKLTNQIVLASISAVVVLYSYQLFSPAFLTIYAFLIFKFTKHRRKAREYVFLFASFVLFAIPTYLLLRVSKAVKSYVYAQGGIVHPNLVMVTILGSLAVAGFMYTYKEIKRDTLIILAVVTNSLLSIYLLTNGIISKRGIYYPTKSLYLSIFLLLAYLIWLVGNQEYPFSGKQKKLIAGLLIFLVMFGIGPFFSRGHGVWYGSNTDLIKSEKDLRSGSYAPYPVGCLKSVFDYAAKETNFDQQSNLLAIKVGGGQSDLVSRWANSLNGRIDNDVLDLGISIGGNPNFEYAVREFRKTHPSENVISQDLLSGCIRSKLT